MPSFGAQFLLPLSIAPVPVSSSYATVAGRLTVTFDKDIDASTVPGANITCRTLGKLRFLSPGANVVGNVIDGAVTDITPQGGLDFSKYENNATILKGTNGKPVDPYEIGVDIMP